MIKPPDNEELDDLLGHLHTTEGNVFTYPLTAYQALQSHDYHFAARLLETQIIAHEEVGCFLVAAQLEEARGNQDRAEKYRRIEESVADQTVA